VITPVPTLVIAIPAMVMLDPAPVTLPVAREEAFAIMPRPDPTRADIGRTSPVALVPAITTSLSIPVGVDPDILGTRPGGHYKMSRRRWRANSDPHRNLAKDRSRRQEQYRDPFFHVSQSSTNNAKL